MFFNTGAECSRRSLSSPDLNNYSPPPSSPRSRRIQLALDRAAAKAAEGRDVADRPGDVRVVPLGFVTNMAEYMVAADVLVSKAGPGTIAEAAAVGLPVMGWMERNKERNKRGGGIGSGGATTDGGP